MGTRLLPLEMPVYLSCTLTMIDCHIFQASIAISTESIPVIASECISKHFSIQRVTKLCNQEFPQEAE